MSPNIDLSPKNAAISTGQVLAGDKSVAKEFKRESGTARVVGAGTAGIAELAIFHPVRLMCTALVIRG